MKKIEAASKVSICNQRLLMYGTHEEVGNSSGDCSIAELIQFKVHTPFRNEPDYWPETHTASEENVQTSLEFVVVEGIGSGDVICMEAGATSTTIQEIVQCISAKHSQKEWDAVSFFFGEYGKSAYFPRDEAFCDSPANPKWQQTIGDFLCWDKAIPVSCKNFGWKMNKGAKKVTFTIQVDFDCEKDLSELPNSVVIRSLTGKFSLQNVFLSDRVGTVKQKIRSKEGIAEEQQRLIWSGQVLEDGKKLSDYEIPDKSVLHLVLRLRGGGGVSPNFVDVTQGRLVNQPWADTAPDWRVCTRGLSIEGVCKNEECVAHRQKVIVNIGIKNFDLTVDAADCKCPMCKQKVVPVKPGFNNCYWRIAAVQKGTETRHFFTDWTRTGDVYCNYDEHACGLAEFLRLQIFVRALRPEWGDNDCLAHIRGPIPLTCAICFESMGYSVGDESCVIQLPCSHIFHKGCTEKWARVLQGKGCPPSCPFCRSCYKAVLC